MVQARTRTHRGRRGVSLIEILVVLSLVAIVMGVVSVGFYGTSGARLKQGSTRVAGAIRVAYAHATAVSKVVRLVFDFEAGTIAMEEAEDRHLLRKDSTGGADPANEAEAQAVAAAEAASMRAPKSGFSPVNLRNYHHVKSDDEDDDTSEFAVPLPKGIQFWQIDVDHQLEPVRSGRAYLYFFPGGQTQHGTIQLRISNADEDDKTGFISVSIPPLTGKTSIRAGRVEAFKPRDETEASEREDPGR